MNEQKINARIKIIKNKIMALKNLRPGSLSKQYNVCGVAGCKCKDKTNPQRHGPYFKLNYAHEGKSKTQFIKDQFAKKVEMETKEFKKLKELTKMWITLEIEKSNLAMKPEDLKIPKKNTKNEIKLES